MSLLSQAAPSTVRAQTDQGETPLHLAASLGKVPVVQALAAAAPATLAVRTHFGDTPLRAALRDRRIEAAQHLLLGSTPGLLSTLAAGGNAALPLYAGLVASRPLTEAEWASVPAPLELLAAVLPAVLDRSPAEARLLVQHLAPDQRQRLRTLALCLVRTQHRVQAHLPAELTLRLLASAGSMLAR